MKQTEYLNLKSKIKKVEDPMVRVILLDFLNRIRDMDMQMDRNCLSKVPKALKEKVESDTLQSAT